MAAVSVRAIVGVHKADGLLLIQWLDQVYVTDHFMVLRLVVIYYRSLFSAIRSINI